MATTKKVLVQHDNEERQVPINAVWCDYGHAVDGREVRTVGDATICDGCYRHFTE
jgi:hypothetical protein